MSKLIKPIGTRQERTTPTSSNKDELNEKTEWQQFHDETAQALETRLKELARPIRISKTGRLQHREELWHSDAQD